ncbi:lipoprotein [Aliiroseovarius sp. KMU-50]|uniref:Lipoprotein n=1 Tax=Aliiroseovarius salicola TaxID=3009082 RepID=A0ABT4W2N5_9RHOB|nr:lipoprotein [Aliiroseovarius sp. KMU-50]MDA5094782.1 lipoprotein [Aliiroseovarius sp. KMU-50]
MKRLVLIALGLAALLSACSEANMVQRADTSMISSAYVVIPPKM